MQKRFPKKELTSSLQVCIIHNTTYGYKGVSMKEETIERWDGQEPVTPPKDKDPEKGVW